MKSLNSLDLIDRSCNYISVMVVNSTFTLCLPLARRARKPPEYDYMREPHVMLRESKSCQNVTMYENCMRECKERKLLECDRVRES